MNLRAKQLGITLSGMLLWSVVLVLGLVLGMKVVPVYLENATIKKNIVAVANDPSLQGANASQIRLAYSKRSQIDGTTVITAKDLKIARDQGQTILSADYTVTVPLFYNVSLLIDFETRSDS